jgi:hypothetical protein
MAESTVTAFLAAHGVDAPLLAARVQERVDARAAEAAAPRDDARGARVAALEEELARLTEQLQQRRQSVPASSAQQLEGRQRDTLLALSAEPAGTSAEDGTENADAPTALVSTLRQYTTVSTACADQASGEVQHALDQANETAAQIGSLASRGGVAGATATDLAIAPPTAPDGREKENVDDAAAAALRKRAEAYKQSAAADARFTALRM